MGEGGVTNSRSGRPLVTRQLLVQQLCARQGRGSMDEKQEAGTGCRCQGSGGRGWSTAAQCTRWTDRSATVARDDISVMRNGDLMAVKGRRAMMMAMVTKTGLLQAPLTERHHSLRLFRTFLSEEFDTDV